VSFLYAEAFFLLILLTPIFIYKHYKSLSFRLYAYIFTFIFIIIAISRPIIEQEPTKNKQVLNDVVIAVDLSYSMQASDIKPTRLEKAKNILKDLVQIEHKTRFGVLGFTTNAIILSPLTSDSELLLHLFNSLDTDLLITKGSDVMPALKLARKMSDSKRLSVVILSDGADDFDYESEAIFAKQNLMTINIFMLATKYGGTLLLDNGGLLKDELGDIVVSSENTAIKKISDATNGVYTKSLDVLLTALYSQRQDDKKSDVIVMKNLELFYYFIVLAIIIFLIGITSLKKFVLAFFLLFGMNLNADLQEYIIDTLDENRAAFNKASRYYKSGEYEKALDNYKRVKSSKAEFKSIVYYNIANSLVRLQEFKKAREAYLKSLTLLYTKEADENLNYIKDVGVKQEMSTGQQKASKKSSIAKKRKNSKKQKEGGSSNMKVKASASSGANDTKKKNNSDVQVNLNNAKAKLSSKQYELINKRVVNEDKPW